MKSATFYIQLFLICALPQINAFHLLAKDSTKIQKYTSSHSTSFALSSTVTTDDESVDDAATVVVDVDYQTEQWTTAMKRSTLIGIAQELRNKYGYLINPLVVPRHKQTELFDAILELEDDFSSSTSTTQDDVIAMLPGDWDLICTMPILPSRMQQQQKQQQLEIPSLFDNEFMQNLFPSSLPVASFTNKFVTITQRIRCSDAVDDSDNQIINRVDHVIEVKPPNQVGDILENSSNNDAAGTPSWLSNLNINPLQVKESKVILVHDAKVVTDDEDASSVSKNDSQKVKLRLKLQSVVNNIAGTGGNLDPNGSDILSVNVPQLDLPVFNTNEWNDALGGSFITTYLDDEYRISRSDLLFSSWNNNNDDDPKNKLQQIRIFQKRRTALPSSSDDEDTAMAAEVDDSNIPEAPSDVEE